MNDIKLREHNDTLVENIVRKKITQSLLELAHNNVSKESNNKKPDLSLVVFINQYFEETKISKEKTSKL